jgi:hypothetical protein
MRTFTIAIDQSVVNFDLDRDCTVAYMEKQICEMHGQNYVELEYDGRLLVPAEEIADVSENVPICATFCSCSPVSLAVKHGLSIEYVKTRGDRFFFEIHFTLPGARDAAMEIDPDRWIGDLKRHLSQEYSLPEHLALLSGGRRLDDREALRNLAIPLEVQYCAFI